MAFGYTLTVAAGKIPSSQGDFTWLAVTSNFPTASKDGGASSILNGGGNLRAYVDDTKAIQLPVEVVTFVTGGTPEILVKGLSPTLNVASTIYIEADSVATTQPASGAAFGRNAVHAVKDFQFNLYSAALDGDSTGKNSPSTIGTLTDDQTSPTGGGVLFTTGDYIGLNSTAGESTGDLTLRTWIRTTASNSFATILGLRLASSWSYQWRLENLDPAILIGSTSPNSPGPALTIGTWYQLALVISGTTITYYRNGVSQGTATVSGSRSLSPANTRIGNTAGGTSTFDVLSSLQNISTEQSAITADRVTSEYNNQSDPTTFFTSSAWVDGSGGGISVTGLLNSNYMVEYSMKKNVASQSIGAQMITISDGSNFTGTVTAEVTIDNGTKTAGGGSVTHEGEGYHSYAPTQAETNGDHIAVSFAGTGALSQTVQVYTTFPQSVDNGTAIAALNDFNPASDTVANVTLVATTTTNTDMRGTNSANTVVPASVAQFNARSILSANYALEASITALNNFNPASDTVENVTLVATTTTNTDMVGTNNALLAASYTAPDNAGITQIQTDVANVPTVTEFNARTLPSADYSQFDFAVNEVSADVTKINGVTIIGAGTSGDLWRA